MKKLVYVAHPYGGKEKNYVYVQDLISTLYTNEHLLVSANTEKTKTVLHRLWHTTIHPLDLSGSVFISPIQQLGFMYDDTSYETGFRRCLDLLDHCDVLLLDGNWTESKGCLAEYTYALGKGMDIIYLRTTDAIALCEGKGEYQ